MPITWPFSECNAASKRRSKFHKLEGYDPLWGGHGGKYLNAASFTALFRANSQNRKRRQIAEAIHLIAANFVNKYHWMPREWREDAASEATLLGLRKIWHYQRNCKHVNAFSYFTKLVQMKVWEQFAAERRRCNGLAPWGRK